MVERGAPHTAETNFAHSLKERFLGVSNNPGLNDQTPFYTSAIDSFLATARKYGLLTGDEVRELFSYREEAIGNIQDLMLSAERAKSSPRIRSSIKNARSIVGAVDEIVITKNLRLVLSVATTKQDRGLDLDDLMQEGVIGLMRAVELYDHKRGFTFSTYAEWWIKQSMDRAIFKDGRTIRVPTHALENIRRLRYLEKLFISEYGRQPTIDELCDLTGLRSQTIKELQECPRVTVSLDQPISDSDGKTTLLDVIGDPQPDDVEFSMDNDILIDRINSLMQSGLLSEQEKTVLYLRYHDGKTLKEIGIEFGITKERIRQIELAVINKLRVAEGIPSSSFICGRPDKRGGEFSYLKLKDLEVLDLTDLQKEILELYYGLRDRKLRSHQEIAQKLSCSATAIKNSLVRSRSCIRAHLRAHH